MSLRAAAAALIVAACTSAPVSPLSSERAPPLNERELTALLEPLAPGESDPGGGRAQAYSMAGREDIVVTLYPETAKPICQPLVRNGVIVSAVDEIVARAGEAQIVIINEAHHDPHGRALIGDVAARLRPIGFSVYAAETLGESGQASTTPYARLRDGYFSVEPTFGVLLTRAHALGYRFVAYESVQRDPALTPEQRGALREQGQAENLRTRIFANDPSARALIHVGHGHVYENIEHPVVGAMMARRLKGMTGIDPLTIDQTVYASPNDDFVICDHPERDDVDLYVGEPRTAFQNGRPVWRQRAGQHPVRVPAIILRKDEPVIVEARAEGLPDDAVPADRLLLPPGETIPLLLAPGRYRVEAWSRGGGWSRPVDVTVR